MERKVIINKTRMTVLGSQIAVADSFFTRLVGLMGKRVLAPGEGLLISPSSGVHTCWMRMKIDVIALDRTNRVIKLGHSVKPWRLSCLSVKAAKIVELPAGRIKDTDTMLGDNCDISGKDSVASL